ncbi:MAG TPA: ribonuclease III, partial [Lachnospiraceae bacterium]|nr:ribonuclease III [Lachnospiraceae bacterium]
RAREYIYKHILKDIEKKKLFYDSKTILQEVVQARHQELEYKLLNEEGPDHNKSFTVAVDINGVMLTTATGKTKKKAEQSAAYQAILKLGIDKDRR